ncbi:hypothetical protein ACIP27_29105, partial [Streptomyces hydrogenans]
ELTDAPRTVSEAFAPLLVEPVDLTGSLSQYLTTPGSGTPTSCGCGGRWNRASSTPCAPS